MHSPLTQYHDMLPSWLQDILHPLHALGLNVVGITDGKPHQDLLPECQSAVVLGNGGTTLWENFVADITAHPEHLSRHQHPFDDFVHRAIQAADPSPPDSRRWIRCAAEPEAFVDFRPLAQGAGLGFASQLGLLIHPEYGLWMGLRAVLLTTESLPHLKAVMGTSPCDACTDKPCIAACPAGAVQPSGWQVKICAQFHQDSIDCHGRCHSRLSCPLGTVHRHSDLQHLYHNSRKKGRLAVAEALGIVDQLKGLDPRWSEWA